MWRMLIILISYTLSANYLNVSTEIVIMGIHFVTVHLLQLELSLVYI